MSSNVNFGGVLLMSQGCKALSGVGCMYTIDRRMDAELPISIYQDEFLANVVFAAMPSFQHENHPKYTLQRASNWCQHNKVNVLMYSAQPTWPHLLEICHNASSTMST